jgi:hypothetical protein
MSSHHNVPPAVRLLLFALNRFPNNKRVSDLLRNRQQLCQGQHQQLTEAHLLPTRPPRLHRGQVHTARHCLGVLQPRTRLGAAGASKERSQMQRCSQCRHRRRVMSERCLSQQSVIQDSHACCLQVTVHA